MGRQSSSTKKPSSVRTSNEQNQVSRRQISVYADKIRKERDDDQHHLLSNESSNVIIAMRKTFDDEITGFAQHMASFTAEQVAIEKNFLGNSTAEDRRVQDAVSDQEIARYQQYCSIVEKLRKKIAEGCTMEEASPATRSNDFRTPSLKRKTSNDTKNTNAPKKHRKSCQ